MPRPKTVFLLFAAKKERGFILSEGTRKTSNTNRVIGNLSVSKMTITNGGLLVNLFRLADLMGYLILCILNKTKNIYSFAFPHTVANLN